MSGEVELLRNPTFEFWTGLVPDDWSQTTAANSTLLRLRKTDPKDFAERRIFTPGLKVSDRDYIWDGESGLRIRMAAGAAAADRAMRQTAAGAAGLHAHQIQNLVLRVTARSTVANRILRARVFSLDGTTDIRTLAPVANTLLQAGGGAVTFWNGTSPLFWQAVTTQFVPLMLQTTWKTWGIPLGTTPAGSEDPALPHTISVGFANGSVGAHDIDIGEVSLSERSFRIGGRVAIGGLSA